MEDFAGHAFISYVREDSGEVDRLQRILEAAGIPVWRDTANLWLGENWSVKIKDAITRDALVLRLLGPGASASAEGQRARFDLSNYRFVEEMDMAAGLDTRPDLLALTPVELEHLIRQLFEAMGMRSWVTQASTNEGVDVIAASGNPIAGGLYIIQVKRYTTVVGLESLYALAGLVEAKRATKGVLVTTSWVGKASRDFVARTAGSG